MCEIPEEFLAKNIWSVISKPNSAESSTSNNPSQPVSLNLKEEIPTIKKGSIDPVATSQTLSLQAIRHTLQGLETNSVKDKFMPFLQNKLTNQNTYIDFLNLAENLRPEQRQEFEQVFEDFNQQRQQDVETRGIEGTREKWRALYDQRVERMRSNRKMSNIYQRSLETLLFEWNEAMLPVIEKEFKFLEQIRTYPSVASIPRHLKNEIKDDISIKERYEYAPYLCSVKPESLAPITMLELLRLNSTGGVAEGMRTARAVLSVGKAVEVEYRMRKAKAMEKKVLKGFGNPDSTDINTLKEVKSAVKHSDLTTTHSSWPPSIRARVGSYLVSVLLQVAKVPVQGKDPTTDQLVRGDAPAFYHTYQYHNGSRLGVIKVHRSIANKLSTESMATAISPQQLPMLVKPIPWTAYNKGGYLYTSTKIMRTKHSPEQVAYLKEASNRGSLDKVYEGLNVLGSTAWTINKDIFEIILKVWNSGESFLDIPKFVDAKPQYPPAPPRNSDPSLRTKYLRECRKIYHDNQKLYSQRCDINYKLEIARAFLGERFYMPHNMDFRGRAYPLTPHLNHLGSDLARGLLKFWDGQELGENGLDWLKIHAANVFGHSKFSLQDRKQFIDDRIDLVLDSANNPTDGQGWWKTAEDPWQTLAVCIDIRNALATGNPSKYISRLAVHQDGSCNGLQHYAALGGDIEGAKEVNLTPSDKPQDVYTRVLQIVQKEVQKDADNGNELAKAVIDKLSRRIIKQTVMTHVYGVTFVGARKQIANKLDDLEELDRREVFLGASYVAYKVLDAVRSLFECAHEIQDWLGENATRISRSVRLDIKPSKSTSTNRHKQDFMSSVIWTTPLGLPIVQPYREESKGQVKTALQTVFITDPYGVRTVNLRKQRTAFPPNFIHSLDATHMLISAVGCGQQGITFAAVHDSYWTHAGTVDKLNKVLRQSFIELYEVDLVERLRDEFVQRYKGMCQVATISTETEIGKKINLLLKEMAEEKGKRKISMDDLLEIEQIRREELNSGAQEGRVTPLSLLENLSDDELSSLIVDDPKVVNLTLKSTEHKGTGADKFEELEEAIEKKRKKAHSSKLATILIPLRIPAVPHRGKFDINQVKESDYFFS